MKKSHKEQLRLRMKLLAMFLQLKDVAEQQKLEKQSGEGVHPNDAASAVIGGEFKLSPHTIEALRELRSVKQQIAAGIENMEVSK